MVLDPTPARLKQACVIYGILLKGPLLCTVITVISVHILKAASTNFWILYLFKVLGCVHPGFSFVKGVIVRGTHHDRSKDSGKDSADPHGSTARTEALIAAAVCDQFVC